MREPLYITGYDDKDARRAKRATHLGSEVDWTVHLPHVWRPLAIGPLWVDVFRDMALRSERWVGHDEDEKPCYCRYRFHVGHGLRDGRTGEVNDGGYNEDLVAWRMRDGRWLIHRTIMRHSDGLTSYAFYSFSETMPR